jgi:hypothetical protein
VVSSPIEGKPAKLALKARARNRILEEQLEKTHRLDFKKLPTEKESELASMKSIGKREELGILRLRMILFGFGYDTYQKGKGAQKASAIKPTSTTTRVLEKIFTGELQASPADYFN